MGMSFCLSFVGFFDSFSFFLFPTGGERSELKHPRSSMETGNRRLFQVEKIYIPNKITNEVTQTKIPFWERSHIPYFLPALLSR